MENEAFVSKDGLVTCESRGTTTIKAYTHDHSEVVGLYELTVVEYNLPVENVEVKPYTDPVCISMGAPIGCNHTLADLNIGSAT